MIYIENIESFSLEVSSRMFSKKFCLIFLKPVDNLMLNVLESVFFNFVYFCFVIPI